MKMKALLVSSLAAVVLSACGGGNAAEDQASKGNETKDVKALVEEYSGNKEAEPASITSDQLIVNESKTYDLPKDEFFVSIAPYVNQTHP